MKKNLEIMNYEDKRTQEKKIPFVRFETSDGWMSCFNKVAYEALKGFEGKTACVEVVQKGDFNNITKCYGEAQNTDELMEDEKPEVVRPGESTVKYSKSTDNHTTMYVSYAKDVFCAITQGQDHATYMNQAIALVKQAKEAFE